MITIKKEQNQTQIHITTTGNAGDYVAMLKTLTNSLANAESADDKQVLGSLITNMLPTEHQLNLD
jgi:hypothetical protein